MGQLTSKLEDEQCLDYSLLGLAILVNILFTFKRLHLNLSIETLKLVFLQDILELDELLQMIFLVLNICVL